MEVSGKRRETNADSTPGGIGKLCELCEADHATTTANGQCRECEEYMCLTCFRHHLKAKTCRHHVLSDTIQSKTPVQKGAANVEKCFIHVNEKIKYYCQKHEVVGCGDCMIPEHSVCRPENIEHFSKGFQQNGDFKSLMRKLEIIMSANNEINKQVKESQKENENMLEEALNGIKQFRTKMNNHLDRAEAGIIEQAKGIRRENDKLLTDLEQKCILLSSKITEMEGKLDTELYLDSALFIQTVKCKPHILDMGREVSRIQRENVIRTFEFIPDKQLQDAISSIEKFGKLDENEKKSQTKLGSVRLTKEVYTKELEGQLKVTLPVKEKKTKGQEQDKSIAVVGARVRPIWHYRNCNWSHNGEPGTVTAVNAGGSVDVKWDDTDRRLRCLIGIHVEVV